MSRATLGMTISLSLTLTVGLACDDGAAEPAKVAADGGAPEGSPAPEEPAAEPAVEPAADSAAEPAADPAAEPAAEDEAPPVIDPNHHMIRGKVMSASKPVGRAVVSFEGFEPKFKIKDDGSFATVPDRFILGEPPYTVHIEAEGFKPKSVEVAALPEEGVDLEIQLEPA
jgi:hypothetical protein